MLLLLSLTQTEADRQASSPRCPRVTVQVLFKKAWLLTFWLLTVYFRVFLTLFSDFVHFEVDFMAFWSFNPALRAFRGAAIFGPLRVMFPFPSAARAK